MSLRIYHARKRVAPSSPERKLVGEAVDLLLAVDGRRASFQLDELEKRVPQPPKPPK